MLTRMGRGHAFFQDKFVRQMHKAGEVLIREIMVIQPLGWRGEHGIATTFAHDRNFIERTEDLIQALFSFASKHHIKENHCADGTGLHVENVNRVTRLSTAEFLFYPAKRNGPFRSDEFANLILLIEKLAMLAPANLHLALGTFPVCVDENNVFNVCVYVQCGETPRLDYFAKAMILNSDPQYHGFHFPLILGRSIVSYLKLHLEQHHSQLLLALKNYDVDKAKIEVTQLLHLVGMSPAEFLEESYADEIYELDRMLLVDELTPKLARHMGKRLTHTFRIVPLQQQFYPFVEDMLHKILCAGSVEGFPYGGVIPCETVGGAKFMTLVDICIDHKLQFAKKSFLNLLTLNQSEAIPIYISQLLISNSSESYQESLLGDDELLSHVDPYYYSIGKFVKCKNPHPKDEGVIEAKTPVKLIASKLVKFMVFKPVKLQLIAQDALTQVDEYNQSYFAAKCLNS